MSGVGISIEVSGLEQAIDVVDRLAALPEGALLTAIGAIGESQTRRRIESEKTSPDGAPWKPNRDGTSILFRSGEHLRDSIAFEVTGAAVRWGSSWQFAHVHQHGATIVPKSAKRLVFRSGGARRFAKKVTIPARPFVGLSAANAVEMNRVVTDFLGHLAQ